MKKILIIFSTVLFVGYVENKKQMDKEQILKRLENDEDYYGEYGNQFLSNSHINKLLKDPLNVFTTSKPSNEFLIGGNFTKGQQDEISSLVNASVDSVKTQIIAEQLLDPDIEDQEKLSDLMIDSIEYDAGNVG